MATSLKERTAGRQVREESPFIPLRYQHAAACATLVLALVVFLWPVIGGGKTFLSPDNIASHSWDTILQDARDQGVFPLWNPYIFCGMPGYASLSFTGDRWFHLTGELVGVVAKAGQFVLLNSPAGWVIVYYMVFAVGMYFFTWTKVQSKIAALVAGLGATFSMWIIHWLMAGHNTKIAVLAALPWGLIVLERLRERFTWLDAFLLTMVISLLLIPTHVQMAYYTFMVFGIYIIFFLVRGLATKTEWKGTLRVGMLLAAASVIALAMDADRYLSVLEYNPYSMRGAAPITASSTQSGGKTLEGGLDYDYATQWSFSPGEMMTFVLPSWSGFGVHEYRSHLTNNQPVRVNTYWGQMPFNEAPQYMGMVILVLAVVGFVRNRKDPFVQFVAIVIVFSLLVSFGRTFSVLYDLLFSYLPWFNKFRIPAMILAIVQVFVPILAAYGVASLLSDRSVTLNSVQDRKWKRILYAIGGGLVLAIVARGAVEDVYAGFVPFKEVAPVIARSNQLTQAAIVQEFYNYVVDMVMVDLYVGLALLFLVFGAFYLYRKNTVKLATLSAVLVVAVLADLWRVDAKPMEPKPRTDQDQVFTAPDYVGFLRQDTSLFRTLLFMNGQPPYDNTLAYWRIHSAYGYQGAKMRAYQDLVDVAGLNNPIVWKLMNVKYLISNTADSTAPLMTVYRGQQFYVYANPEASHRAFFVKRYEVATGLQTLMNMRNMAFDPADVAYVTEDLGVPIDPPEAGASAQVVQYGIQDMEWSINATGNNLLFLSETYYPEGWKALLDGQEVPIHRLNYLFRGIVVPPGQHALEMKFEPRGFALGKNLSLASNILVLGGLGWFGTRWWRTRKFAKTT